MLTFYEPIIRFDSDDHPKHRFRVIIWGIGCLDKLGLSILFEHPELEIVGVYGWSPEEVGRDAGELAGRLPMQVIVMNDVNALVLLKADCLLYFASSSMRVAEATADILPFLESGTNVSTISHSHLQYPVCGKPEFVRSVEAACRKGSASVLLAGEEPGFAFGQHLYALLSSVDRVDRIELTELAYLDRCAAQDFPRTGGLDEDCDKLPPTLTSENSNTWHLNTFHAIADFLEVDVHHFTQTLEILGAEDPEAAGFDVSSAGQTVATKWTVQGDLNGSPFLIFRKIVRLYDGVETMFSQQISGNAGCGAIQKIMIKGDPDIVDELRRFSGTPGAPIFALNSVRFLCCAKSGILTRRDIPLFPPRVARYS